ncbi:unnamed protein product [Caenorhabditis auriculariae]|uniref:Uncharacterized protein n=1 Tax=Caenorhabditis auriculariae TaxID=2777116 RepID=A0A8S1H713_9PELO|nr:unnamed protein product [Caenorhabditis auriculariae]
MMLVRPPCRRLAPESPLKGQIPSETTPGCTHLNLAIAVGSFRLHRQPQMRPFIFLFSVIFAVSLGDTIEGSGGTKAGTNSSTEVFSNSTLIDDAANITKNSSKDSSSSEEEHLTTKNNETSQEDYYSELDDYPLESSDSTAAANGTTTTARPSIPRAPAFTAGSFFIGLLVGLLLIGLIYGAFRFWQSRRVSNNAYAAY